MSVNYAASLSSYVNKGKCGMPEIVDSIADVQEKCNKLIDLFKNSRHTVILTGAGISTAAGIPDFRGPNGVWTLEQRGIAPNLNITFDDARPTFTHYAITALEEAGKVQYLINQNVDGLTLRSGFPRDRLADVHGNMFVERCEKCNAEYIRSKAVPSMTLKRTGNKCLNIKKSRGTSCRGLLRDTVLDWEDALPDLEMSQSEEHCRNADLVLCLGTSLQIQPVGSLPLLAKRKNSSASIAIVNLQSTRLDKQCDLKIRAYVDDVMKMVCGGLPVCDENNVKKDDDQKKSAGKHKIVMRSVHTSLPDKIDSRTYFVDDDYGCTSRIKDVIF